jgi:hypothetical protein
MGHRPDGRRGRELQPCESCMLAVGGRLLLFLLLACDYAGDPGPGVSPLARSFCSTPVYCRASALHQFLVRTILDSIREPELQRDGYASAQDQAATAAGQAWFTAGDRGRGPTASSDFLRDAPLCFLWQHLLWQSSRSLRAVRVRRSPDPPGLRSASRFRGRRRL